MHLIRLFLSIALAMILCVSSAVACAEEKPVCGIALETNADYRTDLYSYVVRGESAIWYIAEADIEKFGLEYLCTGLSGTMEDLELDFADARNVLSGYLADDIPAVKICTDFCDHAAFSEYNAAYYNGTGNFIKTFHSWDAAKGYLLHEYVHYLTFTCARTPIRFGFWSEGIADYVARFICPDRMTFSTHQELPEEAVRMAQGKGVLDPVDGTVNAKRAYLYSAEMFHLGAAVGTEYYAVSNNMIQRTEQIQQNPRPDELSYYEAACMVAYLAEIYGEDYVFSHWNSDPGHFQDIFSQSFPDLYRAWAAWNTLQCGRLGIITE